MKTTIFWEDKRDMAGDVMMFINDVYNGIVMYIYIYIHNIKHSLYYLGVRKGKIYPEQIYGYPIFTQSHLVLVC